MTITQLEKPDLVKLQDIHRRFFEKEFPFPFEQARPFLNKFVIKDDFNNVISFGMLELTAEAIVITDKARDVNDKCAALLKLLTALEWDAQNHGLNMFHCTSQDDKWTRHLMKYGFNKCKGDYLYYRVSNEKVK